MGIPLLLLLHAGTIRTCRQNERTIWHSKESISFDWTMRQGIL